MGFITRARVYGLDGYIVIKRLHFIFSVGRDLLHYYVAVILCDMVPLLLSHYLYSSYGRSYLFKHRLLCLIMWLAVEPAARFCRPVQAHSIFMLIVIFFLNIQIMI